MRGGGDFDTDDDDETPYDTHIDTAAANARKRLEGLPGDDPIVQAYNEMSDEHLGLIRLYTFSYYDQFNKYLRGREIQGLDDQEEKFIRSGVKSIQSALSQVPSSTNSEFYRGMSGDPEVSRTVQAYSGLEPGDVIADKGFCSFTSDREIADDFMVPGGRKQNILLVGNSRRLKSIAPVSGSPSEAEHLAMPGTEFRVRSNEVVDSRMFGKIRVINVEDND